MAKDKLISKDLPSKLDVEEYELLFPLLEALIQEIKSLSQKKQDGALNPLKVKMINKLLKRILMLLKNDPSLEFIELLDEDALPTNSDALFMVVQFRAAMQQYKSKHYKLVSSNGFMDQDVWKWTTKE